MTKKMKTGSPARAMTVKGRGARDDEKLATSIDREGRDAVAAALKIALADSYAMYLKTLGVHWNVTGPSFFGLHKLTDAQYKELHGAADAIAERIRALGHVAPASFSEFREASCVDVETPHKSTPDMLSELVADNEAVARRMLEASNIAEDAGDKFTEDMLIGRIGVHEENAWMLRASIA
ncbi:DNA starvation/stationary phase protection protein [Sandarakinorhabdus sp.]|uniref:Dps family protein n=1 Tax=Sandarakinorhabdus sp. TaxID=1916663 RepID=UPI00286E3F70|nr:DNA starvation/stationary phase protection protein [Sandarakinorhabdus sp.]